VTQNDAISQWKDPEQLSQKILGYLPQQKPFRFLDRIVEIDPGHIVGEYTFSPNEFFYPAHFPGKPVTPGVILVEAMAQTAVVAFGIYLSLLDAEKDPDFDLTQFVSIFTECNAEFLKQVLPGDRVIIKGEKIFWRKRKLKASASLYLAATGELAATATLSGVGVKL
jgi:3-hydroxyacyl-[acyl-carrier-protein] dehydratase